jgi:hypothetical protein
MSNAEVMELKQPAAVKRTRVMLADDHAIVRSGFRRLLAIVFTMHDDPALAERAMRMGARGYVTKSNAPEMLADAIANSHTLIRRKLGVETDVELVKIAQKYHHVTCARHPPPCSHPLGAVGNFSRIIS